MNSTLVALGSTIGIGTGAILGTIIGNTGAGVSFGIAAWLVVGLAFQLNRRCLGEPTAKMDGGEFL